MKRLIAILLALLFLLALPACGSGDTSSTFEPETFDSPEAAMESVNPNGIPITIVDTTDVDAMAALELDFEVVAHDALVIDPALVDEATLLRQSELVGQNVYELGGYLAFAEGVVLPAFYIEPETHILHPAYSARIDVDSYRVYPMRNSSFVTRYKEWVNETRAELLLTAEENPDLAEAALAAADEAALLLRSFDNRAPIEEVYGHTIELRDYKDHAVHFYLPEEWEISVVDIRTGTNTIAFLHNASTEEGAGGLLFSLVLTDDASLGEVVTERDGLYLVATYPTDTQYYVSTMAEYLNLQAMIPDILYTVTIE